MFCINHLTTLHLLPPACCCWHCQILKHSCGSGSKGACQQPGALVARQSDIDVNPMPGMWFACRDLASGKVVAVKFISRPVAKAAIPFMIAEVEIQAELGDGNLNLVTMYDLILTKSHLALVLEYANGGSLTAHVACRWESALQRGGLFMEEQEASYYVRQFIHAIAYCHEHKVAHRDLKLDNTLLEECIVGPSRLKICDFGFAKMWNNSSANMHTAVGTPVYMSPQMLAARQTCSGYSGIKADIWAAGVLLFVMLLGKFPFDHDEQIDTNSSEAAGQVWLKQQQATWRQNPQAAEVLKRGVMSQDCCDLLDKLLERDENKRITTSDALQHPWLHLPLTPEQQAAWERLQQEQAGLDQQLQSARDPCLVRMRRDAMLALLACATKPPSAALFPQPSSQISSPLEQPSAVAAEAAGIADVGGHADQTNSVQHHQHQQHQQHNASKQQQHRSYSKRNFSFQSPFVAPSPVVMTAMSSSAVSSATNGASSSDDYIATCISNRGVAEVWRIPLTIGCAHAAAFKLTPVLSVAAGALIRQLQSGNSSNSKLHGRGRTVRPSCPI
eukprot:GHRR01032855.1.p1 GENE.GHRR01032855.1~~GHRR01032855.1.p1  ORF type:complete len:559 (+),score=192.11 GHRR01032855.1:894-2570(+)